MLKERNKIRIILYGSMILATILGVYAQDIAYLLHNNLTLDLLLGISITTVLSLVLFIMPAVLVSRLNRRKEFKIYLGINLLLGMSISAFSLLVVIAWYG